MSIVQFSDFGLGEFRLPTNRYTTEQQTSMISSLEREWLIKLLGAELYSLFKADLDLDATTPQVPTATKYLTIFNEGAWDTLSNEVVISKGIVYMLKGIIYYHFTRDNNSVNTMSGLVSNNTENAVQENKDKGAQIMTQKLANSMKTFNAIQTYIKANLSDYPSFYGAKIHQPAFYF